MESLDDCSATARECTTTTGPKFPSGPGSKDPCAPLLNSPDGLSCPQLTDPACQIWQLSKSQDACFINSAVAENLNIASADINVHKLLGVHEQGKLIDVTGKGKPISSGFGLGFPPENAFDVFVSEWHSVQKGPNIPISAFIGYNFGTIKTNDDTRDRYGIRAAVRKHIAAIAIKQGDLSKNRVSKIRIERSEDGKKWYGVAIVPLPDDNCLNTVLFGDSVPAPFWRLRALEFQGGDNDVWIVQALQMFHDYVATDESNIQDKIFLENRDRDYSEETFAVKGYYDLIEASTELTKYGIEMPGQIFYFDISFATAVSVLGRPLIIGDILEVPSEAQFSRDLKRVKKYLEVTDVAWSTQGYTPGWMPTLLRVTGQQAYASQETQDIFGDLHDNIDPITGLIDKNEGNNPNWQDYHDAMHTAEALSKDDVPERGAEASSVVRQFEVSEIEAAKASGYPHLTKLGLNPQGKYVEDAMPPNNKPFTEANDFPLSPVNGAYHRLTYTHLKEFYPPRLYRWSAIKNRWIFLEKDKRLQYNNAKPRLTEFLENKGAVPHDEISK